MPKFSSDSLDKFLEKLGSSEPVPGGGAAASLVAAQAAALGEMVARLNLKRSEKQGLKNISSKKNISQFRKFRANFLAFMRADAQVFSRLSKFKKDDRGKKAYQEALKKAAGVPYEMCLEAECGARMLLTEKDATSQWLYSDLLESALLFEAGFAAARLNVEINLGLLADKDFVARMNEGLRWMSQSIERSRKALRK